MSNMEVVETPEAKMNAAKEAAAELYRRLEAIDRDEDWSQFVVTSRLHSFTFLGRPMAAPPGNPCAALPARISSLLFSKGGTPGTKWPSERSKT